MVKFYRWFIVLMLLSVLCISGCGKKDEAQAEEQGTMDDLEESAAALSGDLLADTDVGSSDDGTVSAETVEGDADAVSSIPGIPVSSSDSGSGSVSVDATQSQDLSWTSNIADAAERAGIRNKNAMSGPYGDWLKSNFNGDTLYAVVTIVTGEDVLLVVPDDGEWHIGKYYIPQSDKADVYYYDGNDVVYAGTAVADGQHAETIGITQDGYLSSIGFGDDLQFADNDSWPIECMKIKVDTTGGGLSVYDYASHPDKGVYSYAMESDQVFNDGSKFDALYEECCDGREAGVYFSYVDGREIEEP